MTEQASDRSKSVLASLATLVNLLSLRNGGPVDLAKSSSMGFDTDGGIDGDPDDLSSDSGRFHEIAGVSADSLEELRRRFLDRLAELCAAGRNGASVTATMLREVEREDHVDIWLARNGGFRAAEDKEIIQVTETMLDQIAGGLDPGKVTSSFWTQAVRYCSERLQFEQLGKRLASSQPVIQEIIRSNTCSADEPDMRIMHAICDHFFEPRDPSETRYSRLEHLAALGADVREAVHEGRCLTRFLTNSIDTQSHNYVLSHWKT